MTSAAEATTERYRRAGETADVELAMSTFAEDAVLHSPLTDRVRFTGRILFLTEDPELIKRQLAGEDLPWTPEMKLRDNISTDEITPAYICYYFDDTLGEFPYLGLKAGEEFPITRGAVTSRPSQAPPRSALSRPLTRPVASRRPVSMISGGSTANCRS